MIEIFAKEIDREVPEQLQGLVLAFILGETTKRIQERIPMYPTGFPLLVNIFGSLPEITINEKKIKIESRTIVAGQIFNTKIHSDFQGVFGQIGIILHPSAPYYLFHQSGEILKNMWTSFEEICPVNTDSLIENLSDLNLSNKERLDQLVSFLTVLESQRLPCILWLEDSIARIFEQNGNIDQKELLVNSGICPRHFRRVFKKIIGVSPKYFCKVVQMNTAFESIKNSESVDLHHIALDCGYYDQAHFINDFRGMFGVSPEKFLSGEDAYLKNYMGRRGT